RLLALYGVHQLLVRPADPVRLHLDADPSHARRHPPPDLGYRARLRATRARDACARDHRRLGHAHAAIVDRRLLHHRRRAMSDMRTPLARVEGLGSARSGTSHFWWQRMTAVFNVPLTIAFVVIIASLFGRNQAFAQQTLGTPLVAVIMLLFIGSITYHMRL